MLDGRTAVIDRGRSLVPAIAEQLGFVVDLSGGLRGLMKRLVRAGDAARGTPQPYAECLVHYQYRPSVQVEEVDASQWEAEYLKTSPVDGSDESGAPLELVAAAGQVTQGFDEALVTMHCGEVADLWLDPAFAFRDNSLRTSRGMIPAGMPVLLRLELVSFENPLTPRSRISAANDRHRNAGNDLFRRGDFAGAQLQYARALRTLGSGVLCGTDTPAAMREEIVALDRAARLAIHGNLAACAFQLGELEKATLCIERALKIDPLHVKSILKKAAILRRRQDYGAARVAVRCRLAIPDVVDSASAAALEAELALIEAEEAQQKAASSALFKRMI